MPNKNLDGIKKLSGEELERARKIVLDSIGERDKRERKEKDISNFSLSGRKKMLDGISSGRVRSASKKIIITKNEALKKKESLGKDLGVEYQKKEKEAPVILPSSRPVAFKRLLASGVAQIGKAAREEAEFKKQESKKTKKQLPPESPPQRDRWDREKRGGEKIRIEEERRRKEMEAQKRERVMAKEAEAKIRVEKEKEKIRIKKQEEKIRAEEERRRKEAEKNIREIEEAKAKEEERRKKELEKQREKEAEARKRAEAEKERLKLKKEKEKIRQERKEQRESARKIWLAEKKRKLLELRGSLKGSFGRAGRILVLAVAFSAVLEILFYFIFALLLLRFNLDNEISRQIAGYVPVPAVITKVGFIEYYDYQTIMAELEKELGSGQELEPAAKVIFIEKISLINLASKYNVSLSGREQEEVEKEINARLAVDKEANEVSYSRINKIRQLVLRSISAQTAGRLAESFEEIGGKYGDEQGYVNENNEYLQLKEEVRQLESGQISDIIITDRGYYIVKKEDKRLKYIFVKSVTLDEYLNDMVNKLKVWVLAN